MLHRESCAGCREAVGEALTAARVGGVLSTETIVFPSAEAVSAAEGEIGHAGRDEAWTGSAVSKHAVHARTSNIGNWEIFESCRRITAGIAEGRRKAEAEDARREEVRRGHSSEESGEQPDASRAEPPERRAAINGNPGGTDMSRVQDRENMPSGAERIRQAARRKPKEKLTALLHHLTPETLGAAYDALKREAAPGVDGMSWEEYGQGRDERLRDLHERVHRGAYRAKPVRRVKIPKPDGGKRALGVAALEDKILQRAMVDTILTPIYETEFIGFSYGFRPGRGAHDALDALAYGIMRRKINWIVDADIRQYFDRIDREWMIRFLEVRIGDRRVLRLIQKWLNAGVMEAGKQTDSGQGTPQGAVVSPVLANVYRNVCARSTTASGSAFGRTCSWPSWRTMRSTSCGSAWPRPATMPVGPRYGTSWPIGCARPRPCNARTGVGSRRVRTRARHRGPPRHRTGRAAATASAEAGDRGAGCRPGALNKLRSRGAILTSGLPISYGCSTA